MQQLNLATVELADCPVVETVLTGSTSILFVFEQSFNCDDQKWLGRTELRISDWSELLAENYVTTAPFEPGIFVSVNWQENAEPFSEIQQVIMNGNDLTLSGFGKMPGYLTYRFQNCRIELRAEPLSTQS